MSKRRICRICRRWVPESHCTLIRERTAKGSRIPVCASSVETVLGWAPCESPKKRGPSAAVGILDLVIEASNRLKTESPRAR